MAETINILLVDDDKGFADILTYWLRNKGYAVDIAGDGKAALKRLAESSPNVVFLDINMPELDGVETLRRIREKDLNLPVIMLTAYGTAQKLEETRKLGISGFFPKESDFKDLVGIIDAAIRIHKHRQDS
ncbi:MAG: response regulator [Candidatus Omnitrophica bacterium]|nr:response regulator [Candidatus Omnitrophota bacterium]